ncbi:AraC family transcriptional regulator [Pyxidicoccus fallax]|uniref:AraC family transcriptional regulator n=1 Tax=Pyxidicoccus fallax TaxID=394095 RepID=A0A848LJF5_9BACT|nr:AraC family transcriptional regulator [Pyxidicoccus fallax]NMO17861.1 AraC family transcriptional regulator [Pyxidicoccus fallax]NPC81393.1 AraC family transcriptional regulator [Pyxidicoccus fallax]
MDVLAETLRGIHMRSTVHSRLELSAPWGLRVEARDRPSFHVVVRGGCLLETGGTHHTLAQGDFVFILGRVSYVFRDSEKTRPLPASEIYGRCGSTVRHGGGGAATTLLCGGFDFDGTPLSPLIASLPPILHVKGDGGVGSRWLESTMQLVVSELEAARPGHETMTSRLGDVLLVQALREHVAALPAGQGGWLAALVDPRLGPALQRIHERPEMAWTVEGLARAAGMSRSVFAARFKSLVGEGPLTYVTRWRMHRAMQLMGTGTRSTSEVAQAVGYETDSAFVKAFKRHVGETPGTWKRRLTG